MDPFGANNSYWDLVQQPSGFSTIGDDDFLALLQKQFPTALASNSDKPLEQQQQHPPDGVDPQSISTFPLPNPSPPSSDSSPSPPSANDSNLPPSRRQSGAFTPDTLSNEDPSLKRKASDESMDVDPSLKNAHINPSSIRKSSSSSRRRASGDPRQDEFRLLKRKEQNRAAQRAFRERKEKHVKDLEDKVAALEAKNQVAESENENLRDLLSRLQSENMALKQQQQQQQQQNQFAFAMQKTNEMAASPTSYNGATPTNGEAQFRFQSTGAAGAAGKATSPMPPPFDFNFGSLIPFDPAVLNVLDEVPQTTATEDAMNMDVSFGDWGGVQPRTLASNPMCMSFGDAMAFDMNNGGGPTPPSNGTQPGNGGAHGALTFGDWSPPTLPSDMNGLASRSIDSLDQLFAGNSYIGAQSPVDFGALLRTPPSTISPVQHAMRSGSTNSIPSLSSGSSSETSSSRTTPTTSSPSSSPASNPLNNSSNNNHHNHHSNPNLNPGHVGNGKCPNTKEEMAEVIRKSGTSSFVDMPAPPPPASLVRKCEAADGGGQMIMCAGSSFPKTEQSERNIEVLTAWRSITSNPQFKDVDINDLCTEFTAKARCDGTKVVLEPEGVSHIIETLSAKRKQGPSGAPGSQQQQQK